MAEIRLVPGSVNSRADKGTDQTLFRITLKSFLRNPRGPMGLALISMMSIIALTAPIIAPYDPLVMNKLDQLAPPSPQYLFGTDEFGRDILSRVIYGSRVSISTAAVAVMIAISIGVPLGLVSGYFGGRLDTVIMRAMDCIMAFPAILLAMTIVAVMGVSSENAMIAVGVVKIPAFARLTRASTLVQKQRDYVEASTAMGSTHPRIMFRTILPNCLGPIMVQIAIAAASAVLLEAALSFLGLGTNPPTPSWGNLLNSGRSHLSRAPWYGVFPGIAITLLVLSLNLVSDALQKALDPARHAL